MKKQLQTTKFFMRLGMAAALFLASHSAFGQQMSGAVTIDAAASPSTSNFQNWYSFWRSLQGQTRSDGGPALSAGVTGPVTVSVLSSLTESSRIEFPAISGMSPTNNITIDGGNNFVAFDSSYEVISFIGGDHFTIKNLTVRHTLNSTTIRGIRFSNNSDSNTIDKCTIEFSALTGTSTSGAAYIAFAGSQTSLTSTISSGQNGINNTISNCIMRTTNTNSPGPTWGILEQQNTSTYTSTSTNNSYSNNTIENFYYYGFYMRYTNGTQLLNNDISRKNTTANNSFSTLYGIYTLYSYGTNRPFKVDNNNVHDLPFVGASTTNANSTTYGIYTNYTYGTTGTKTTMNNNIYKNVYSTGAQYALYANYTYYGEINKNSISNVYQGTSTAARFYGIYPNRGQEVNVIGNTIQTIRCNYYFYGIYPYYTSGNDMKLSENVIQDIKSNTSNFHYIYCIYPYYTNYIIEKNVIDDVRMQGYGAGYIYGIYPYYCDEVKVYSNRLTRLTGYYNTYGIYPYSFNSSHRKVDVRQNTVAIDGSVANYSNHYGYPIYCYYYYANDFNVVGNIFTIEGGYGAYPAYQYNSTPNGINFNWNHNTYWTRNISYQYWNNVAGNGGDFSAWMNTGLPGSGERFEDPLFKNPGAADFRSDNFFAQNNVPTVSQVPQDVTGASRNIIMSDRGAVESFMDIKAVSTNFSVPATVCAGYMAGAGTSMTVENLFAPDTAYNFNIAYTVNGKNKQSVKVTDKLLLNGTSTVSFPNSVQLNEVGNNRIVFFIDIPDDNRSNDSIVFSTFVKPAPGGGKITASVKPTKALYQYGKPNDVTVITEPVIYDVTSPRAYTNTEYGSGNKWVASAWAETSNGTVRPSSEITLTAPASGNDLEVQFKTNDANLEDSMITVKIKISDLTNSCDTILTRKVLVYPTINPDFAFPAKICDGDDVLFENKSTVQSGNMEFLWNFGTGNPADTTQAPEPVFKFPASGNYTVVMKAKTLPYGFAVSKSYNITVSPIPTVGFSKINACMGTAVQFTNTTTPASLYTWEFGDATTSNATSPSHNYPAPGAYNVTLKANLSGCIAEMTQRVYQFVNPVAKGKVIAGNCDNEEFEFENTSSIASGLFGSMWDFADGNVSTEDEPEHNYATSGVKGVMLTTTSEFGCKDTQRIWVNVKESPKVNFSNTAACSIDPTQFTNLTPSVANAIVTEYSWDFGDGGSSNAESPSHVWGSLGPKTVVYTIELDNGCKGMMSKDLSVGVQPQANFNVTNVCAGDPAVFDNNTTWSQGDISFSWNFGDNTSSTNSDPTKMYNVTSTTTYNVELTASIAGGCSNSITKPITINEGPTTCDFVFNTDYAFGFYGIKLDPINGSGTVGGQTGVEYTWVFTGGGTDKTNGSGLQKDLQTDGTYEVTMRAKVLSTGCMCTKTKTVVMNRTAVEDLEKVGVALYPNPNAGNFNIALTESFGANVKVEILTLTGAKVKEVSAMNNGLIQIEGSEMMNGVYLVRISSGEKMVTKKITVQK